MQMSIFFLNVFYFLVVISFTAIDLNGHETKHERDVGNKKEMVKTGKRLPSEILNVISA